MQILNFIRKIKKSLSKYDHSIKVFISKGALLNNFYEFKHKYKDFYFAPVLKSNAYGHSLLLVAKVFEKEKDIPFFVVDSIFEAKVLKHNNIKKGILIIGYTKLQNILNYNSKRFIFNIISLEELYNLDKYLKSKIRIHLKIDTGMHRQGILFEQIDEAITIIKNNQNFVLEGISSHFSEADSEDKSFTENQIQIWKQAVNIFKKEFPNIKYFHISATSGVTFMEKDFANLVRLGIGLYGVNISHDKDLNLKGVMRVESIISSIKNLKKGDSIGYGNTYILDKDSKVGTVTAGYFEGVDRRLSSAGYFKVRDKLCKILGRVSMNITSIDVSEIYDLKLEEKVILISEKKLDKNSLENIAKLCDTIPYEIMVHVAPHLKREIINDFE